MAPLEDDLNQEQKMQLALAQQDDLQERELFKIKTNAAIAAAPVAFFVGWGILYGLHLLGRPEDWLITLLSPIITTALASLAAGGLATLTRKRIRKRKAQQEKV